MAENTSFMGSQANKRKRGGTTLYSNPIQYNLIYIYILYTHTHAKYKSQLNILKLLLNEQKPIIISYTFQKRPAHLDLQYPNFYIIPSYPISYCIPMVFSSFFDIYFLDTFYSIPLVQDPSPRVLRDLQQIRLPHLQRRPRHEGPPWRPCRRGVQWRQRLGHRAGNTGADHGPTVLLGTGEHLLDM